MTEASETEETETGNDNAARAKAVSNGDRKEVGDERRLEAAEVEENSQTRREKGEVKKEERAEAVQDR